MSYWTRYHTIFLLGVCILILTGCGWLSHEVRDDGVTRWDVITGVVAEQAEKASGWLPPPWNQIAQWVGVVLGGSGLAYGTTKTVASVKNSVPGSFLGPAKT